MKNLDRRTSRRTETQEGQEKRKESLIEDVVILFTPYLFISIFLSISNRDFTDTLPHFSAESWLDTDLSVEKEVIYVGRTQWPVTIVVSSVSYFPLVHDSHYTLNISLSLTQEDNMTYWYSGQGEFSIRFLSHVRTREHVCVIFQTSSWS